VRKSQTIAGVFVVTIALMSSLPLAKEDRGQQYRDPAVCVMSFEANVRHGPSAGLALQGVLTLQVEPDGRIDTGVLALADGSTIPVVGQTNGRAINLFFDLGDGTFIAGVGTAQYAVRECRGPMGGPFTGPLDGDAGDWFVDQNPTFPSHGH